MFQQFGLWFMEPSNLTLTIGIIAVFILGIIAGRFFRNNKRKSVKTVVWHKDEAFLKGVKFCSTLLYK